MNPVVAKKFRRLLEELPEDYEYPFRTRAAFDVSGANLAQFREAR
jgi:hypothetical protein